MERPNFLTRLKASAGAVAARFVPNPPGAHIDWTAPSADYPKLNQAEADSLMRFEAWADISRLAHDVESARYEELQRKAAGYNDKEEKIVDLADYSNPFC